MAIQASCNVSTATNGGAAVIWNVIDLLVATAGTWTIDSSNDGSGGAVFNETTLNNTDAWVVIEDLVVGRQILFHRRANDYTWTISYDRAGAFAIDPSIEPWLSTNPHAPPESATDQVLLNNAALFTSGLGTYVGHAVCDDTAQTALFDVFPFWFGAGLTGGSPGWSGGMLFLPTTNNDSTDADPVIMICSNGINWLGSSNIRKYSRYGLSGESWDSFSRLTSTLSSNSDDYGRGYLGFTQVWHSLGQLAFGSWCLSTTANFTYPDTRDLVSGPAYVFAAGNLLPWPVGVTPTV
jgi:hypothetical protein